MSKLEAINLSVQICCYPLFVFRKVNYFPAIKVYLDMWCSRRYLHSDYSLSTENGMLKKYEHRTSVIKLQLNTEIYPKTI